MRKNNNKFYSIFIVSIIIGIIAMLIFLSIKSDYKNENNNEPHNINIFLNSDNKLEINYEGSKNVYILVSDSEEYDINDERFEKINNRKATYGLVDYPQYYYLKYNNKIYETLSNEDVCYVQLSIENNKQLYLAKDEEIDFVYDLNVEGYTNKKVMWQSSDNSIASVEDGHLIAKETGDVTITAHLLNKSAIRHISITDLIIKAPNEFDENKVLLPCEVYSEEENDLLDEILETRINEAGYQSRAGVVEAARFITLNFPYKIKYCYEWGRQGIDKIDGEGRYYLKGLYLNDSRFSRLIGSNGKPATWGCKLYSNNVKSFVYNGLDCSGFVTWAILNGGFDCGDIGAGIVSGIKDLTNLGQIAKINDDTLSKTKVGDLVHSAYTGGHIGVIIGIDENNNYYIAEATPKEKVEALVVTKLDKKSFMKAWDEIILMDSYYLEDGKLTDMWY